MLNLRTANRTWLVLAWMMCGLAVLFYFYEFTLRVTPGVITHQLMNSYNLNARTYGGLSVSFYYIYVPMQIVAGLLIDRYGPRRVLTLAAMMSAIGIYFFASMQSLFIAQLGRLLIGLGSSFAFVGVLKLATIWLSTERFAFISGTTMAVGMMGGVVGDLVLMELVKFQGWRLACYFIACFGLLLSVFLFIFVRDNRAELRDPSFVNSSVSFNVLCDGLIRLIKTPQMWLNGVVGCLLFMPVSGFAECWQIPYLSFVANFTHHDAVIGASMVFLGWAVGAPVVGWLSDEFQVRRLPISIGGAMSAILITYILYVPPADKDMMYALLFLYGVFASVQSITYAICCEDTPKELTGTSIALTSMIVMLSGFSVYIVGAILEALWSGEMLNGLHVYSITDYQYAFLIFPIAVVGAVVLSIYLRHE